MKKEIKIIIFIFCLLPIAYCDANFFLKAFENDEKKKKEFFL